MAINFLQSLTNMGGVKPSSTKTTTPSKIDITKLSGYQAPSTVSNNLLTSAIAKPTPVVPRVDNTPVTIPQLQSTQVIPPAPVGTSALDTLNFTTSRAMTPKVTDRETGLTRLSDLLEKQGTKGTRFDEVARDTKLFETEQAYRDAQAEEARINREYENRLRQMREGAVGASEGALQAQAQELRRKASQEKADLAIVTAARQGDLQTAQNIVQQKIDAEFEPINQQIETLKTFLTLNQDDLTTSEKMMLQAQIDQRSTQLANEYDNAVIQNQAQVYQQMLDGGTITIDKVPKEVLGYLNTQGYVPAEQKASIDKSRSLLANINDFLGTGATTAVGPGFQKIFGATGSFLGFGSYAEKKAQVDNIKALLTLDNLKLMTGVLTDRDIQLLGQAASRLNPDMKEDAFRKELGNIAGTLQDKLLNSQAVSIDEKGVILTDKIQRENPNYSVEDVKEAVRTALPTYQTTFRQAGNASASTIANAIKTVESQGNYNARGASGEFGAYQFMPSTWKQWAGEFLGDPNAQPTPQNQDFVAQSKINQLISQGYNPQEIALIWNGGEPKIKKGVNKFGVAYDSGAYAQKVINQLTA